MDFYNVKYPKADLAIARLSLLYHGEVDLTVPVILKDGSLTWEIVKDSIVSAVGGYKRTQHNQEWGQEDNDNSEDMKRGRGGYRR